MDHADSELTFNNRHQRPELPRHVVILHEKLMKRSSDRYIINLGLSFNKIGYKVTVLTSQYKKHDCIQDIEFAHAMDIKFSGWWIPRSILGLFKSNMSAIKAAWMAYRIICFPPNPKPSLIVLDISILAIYMLKFFTKYKIFYLESFADLKNTENLSDSSRVRPTLFEAKWIKLSDEIIVESHGFAEIFKKSYPSVSRQPKIMYPSVDLGLWNEPGIKIHRIIPDLLDNTVIFLTIGKFKRSSNFKLALDAFEILLGLIDDKTTTKRFQLVIAGNCKTIDEKFYYNDLVLSTKERICASQVTFLKQLPIIHEKTLIVESAILIHPAKNDVFSDFVLRGMNLGRPIVATTKGFAAKLLTHRLSGVIIEPDAKLFAVALKKLMMSPHLQIFLGDMAKDAFQKHYSFDSMCEKLTATMTKYTPLEIIDRPQIMSNI